MTIDRVRVNRALAKAIAFKQCGQDEKAAAWAVELVRMLECHEILDTHEVGRLESQEMGALK